MILHRKTFDKFSISISSLGSTISLNSRINSWLWHKFFCIDHGLEVLSQWVAQSDFPWLMSNVLDNETGRPLGEGRITHVVHWAGGRRIGLLGLVEKEWLDTLATINPEGVTFLDFVEAGQKLAAQLKQEVRIFEEYPTGFYYSGCRGAIM